MPMMGNHPNRGGKFKAGANPTPAMVRAAREELGLDREQAGELVYTSERGFQNWELDEDAAEHRRMHPATWELFQAKCAALKLIAKRKLSLGDLQDLGIHLPAWALEHMKARA